MAPTTLRGDASEFEPTTVLNATATPFSFIPKPGTHTPGFVQNLIKPPNELKDTIYTHIFSTNDRFRRHGAERVRRGQCYGDNGGGWLLRCFVSMYPNLTLPCAEYCKLHGRGLQVLRVNRKLKEDANAWLDKYTTFYALSDRGVQPITRLIAGEKLPNRKAGIEVKIQAAPLIYERDVAYRGRQIDQRFIAGIDVPEWEDLHRIDDLVYLWTEALVPTTMYMPHEQAFTTALLLTRNLVHDFIADVLANAPSPKITIDTASWPKYGGIEWTERSTPGYDLIIESPCLLTWNGASPLMKVRFQWPLASDFAPSPQSNPLVISISIPLPPSDLRGKSFEIHHKKLRYSSTYEPGYPANKGVSTELVRWVHGEELYVRLAALRCYALQQTLEVRVKDVKRELADLPDQSEKNGRINAYRARFHD